MPSDASSEPAVGRATETSSTVLTLALVGLLLPVLLLAATASSADYPARQFSAELRMLVILYPFAILAALRHAARRSPKLLRAALLLFITAVTVRTAASCYITEVYARERALLVGASNSDAYLYSLAARFVASNITSQTYHTESEWQAVRNIGRIRTLFGGDADATASPIAISVMAWVGVLIPLTGFSTMALNLVMVLLGSFLCVQVFVLLSRFCRPAVVLLVTFWVVVGPEYVWFSSGYFKEMPACIALVYLADYLFSLPARRGQLIGGALGCTALLFLSREQYVYFTIPMIGYALWDERLVQAGASQRLRNILAVTTFLLIAAMLNLARARYDANLASWLSGYVTTLLVLPPLTWFLSPEVFNDNAMTVMLPLAFVWLLVGAGLLVGALLTKAQLLRFPQRLVILTLVFCLMISITLPNTNTIVRYRLPCEPLLLAFAAEAFALLPRLKPDRQRRILSLSLVWIVLQVLASVADSLRAQLR